MGWNEIKINNHIKAAELLNKIKDDVFQYIKRNKDVTEYNVQQFILKQFKQNNLKTNKLLPIVAFRQNTSFVHYHPSEHSKKIKPESLIMIDIWARLKEKYSPFADITWMGYYGKNISKEVLKIFKVVIEARNSAIQYVEDILKQEKIPTTNKIDKIARNIISQNGFGKNFLHTTGHSLGFVSPHGGKRIGHKSKGLLMQNVAYTIEPGIYFKDKFGVRSEINFFINKENRLIITTKVQNKIVII